MTAIILSDHLQQHRHELIARCRAGGDVSVKRLAAEFLLTRLHQLAERPQAEQQETLPHLYREWQLLLAAVPEWWPLLSSPRETSRAHPDEHPDLLQLIEATGFVRNIFVEAETPTNKSHTSTPADEASTTVRGSWVTRLWQRIFGRTQS